ncbi:hypothetical protein V5F53_20975 [Xanthobacter sp. V4C-4]|uniref:hypothetical protein n=1 Tax=Xanthobacter cornucopiae TaxID=3119924 RepID=UPI0037267DFD
MKPPCSEPARPGAALSRADVRAARERLLAGDAQAARRLLAHSVAQGHGRLALRRYFIARVLGADDLSPFETALGQLARGVARDDLMAMARDAMGLADRLGRGVVHGPRSGEGHGDMERSAR